MSRIVSNATPLIFLAKVGKLELLKTIFKEVFIPEEVKFEVVEKGKRLDKKDAYIVEKAIIDGWIKVLRAEIIEIPVKLDPGEVAVISLAKSLNAEVLIDEVSARTAARLLDLKPRGTIFVLLKALKEKVIDMDEFLEILNQMIGYNFRLKEEVYIEVIREARRIVDSKE
jgi:predicted nucleic acid-binding protein